MKNFIILSLGSLLSFSLTAQTGPGGVGNSTTNAIWLDGDVLTYSTIPNISSWPDQSGNGNDFNQNNTSRQPSRVTYPGHTALRFDGGDFVRRGGVGALNVNTNTQYIVYNGFRPNHVGILYESSYTQSNQFFRTYRNNGTVKSWVLNSGLGAVQNSTSNSSTFQIISSYWDGGAQTYDSYKDGAATQSKVGADGNPTGNSRNTIGAASNNAYKFDGDIGEVIIFNTVLNSAQRNIIDNYLSSKFSVSISNDMYSFESTGHQYQLVGVGQEADGNNLVAQGKSIMELNAAGLSNGDYIMIAHDNTSLAQTTNDVPASISGGTRITRTWRADVTGAPGTVDIDVDVSSLSLASGSYYLIVESVNGVFNDGGTFEYGPVADVGGIASFSGVTLAAGDYFTIGTDNGSTIVSKKTGFWDVASTWNCNCVPGSTDDVTIKSGHTVTARTITNVNDLTINGNINSQQTGSFNVKGDYTIGATGTIVHKVLTFNGSALQNINNSSATTANFSTLIINNSSNVAIQSGDFSISGSISVPNGQFQNVGGTCTFLSTATSTAVITNGSGGFSGTFTLQRYISGRTANWGDMGSPVSNATLGSWDSDQSGTVTEIYMSGVNGIDGVAGGFESVYRYDAPTQAYIAITDTNYALVAGEAVELWMADDPTSWFAKTFDTHGTPNSGSIGVSLSTSFNLVSNPYQAWVSWSALTKPTISSNTYYMYNTNTGNYDAFTSGNIPPYHGFWVESVGAGTLTFNENDKTGSASSSFYKYGEDFSFPAVDDEDFMRDAEEPVEFTEIKLKVSSELNTYSHELKLRLNNLATEGYDEFDASFLKSRVYEAPSISTFANDAQKELAINSFNYQDEVVMPIKINVGVTGEYFIEPINVEALDLDFEYIELIDHQTGMVYNLKEATKGGVSVEIDENDDTERFTLRLSNLNGSATVDASANVDIYKNNSHTMIEIDNVDLNFEVSVYNAIGQKVMEDIVNAGSDKLMIENSKFPQGMNIITVRTRDGKVISEKLTY